MMMMIMMTTTITTATTTAMMMMNITHMLFEIKITAKSFGTHATLIRLEVRMRVHMEFKIVDLMKRFITQRAFVFFRARVC